MFTVSLTVMENVLMQLINNDNSLNISLPFLWKLPLVVVWNVVIILRLIGQYVFIKQRGYSSHVFIFSFITMRFQPHMREQISSCKGRCGIKINPWSREAVKAVLQTPDSNVCSSAPCCLRCRTAATCTAYRRHLSSCQEFGKEGKTATTTENTSATFTDLWPL